MRNILKSVSALAALTSLAFAGEEPKDLKKVVEEQGIYVETAKPGVVLSGYVDAGYSYNSMGNNPVSTRFPTDGGNYNGSQGRGSNFNLNAFKLALEKPLSDKDEWSAGFRADLIYGDDAFALANAGTSLFGFAHTSNELLLEQAFIQLRAPVGNGIDFKIGKFVTPLGYEVIERPANANISYGNLFQNMIPLYHTGILASYRVNSIVDVKFGVVNGADNDQQSVFSTFNNSSTNNQGAGLLGTVNVTAPGGNANLQQGAFLGLNQAGNSASFFGQNDTLTNNALWVYDIWGQWKPRFAGDKLSLGFNGDIGEGSEVFFLGGPISTTTWSGAAVYAKYQFTKLFSLATRTDWIHGSNAGKFQPNGTSGAADVYSFTATASFDIWENTLLRAEYRGDYGSEGLTSSAGMDGSSYAGAFSGNTTDKGIAHLIDLQVVYSF